MLAIDVWTALAQQVQRPSRRPLPVIQVLDSDVPFGPWAIKSSLRSHKVLYKFLFVIVLSFTRIHPTTPRVTPRRELNAEDLGLGTHPLPPAPEERKQRRSNANLTRANELLREPRHPPRRHIPGTPYTFSFK
ncbi:hypothetical protein EVAR_39100_1 [Eumeta japonica]|uniref:Uncharacterized protein n=1 Tax=Eumeta variegata TaxID=151549 RepID=A0A4C1X3X0_EUMVA|nr:hypothetical protein EVAR_39100_1 [Eumeta japonica]